MTNHLRTGTPAERSSRLIPMQVPQYTLGRILGTWAAAAHGRDGLGSRSLAGWDI